MKPNDLGEKILIESCACVKISDILRGYKLTYKQYLFTSELQILGFNVDLLTSKTGFGGKRLWIECPICKKRKGVIYKHLISNIIGCRTCLRLTYRKQRYKDMIENKI